MSQVIECRAFVISTAESTPSQEADRPLNSHPARVFIARHKSDFALQPVAIDSDGARTIPRNELGAEVAAHYDSGLTDYV
jgi:hypothetical protein